jgi:hypothetical protein
MGARKWTVRAVEQVRELGVQRLGPPIAVLAVAGVLVADLGGMDVHWAPIGTWLGALGTFAAVTIALVNSQRAERVRLEDERMLQARRAAAWMWSERVISGMDRVIIENGSKQPLHEVVLTIVVLHGSGPHLGEEMWSGQFDPVPGGIVTPLPPGRWKIDVPPYSGGMNKVPAVEMAFTDQAGRHWIRRAHGQLEEIPLDPITHYGIHRPFGYLIPERSQ